MLSRATRPLTRLPNLATQVGAVVSLGAYRFGASGTNWRLFGKIALSWACTLPFAGGIAAAMTLAARAAITRAD